MFRYCFLGWWFTESFATNTVSHSQPCLFITRIFLSAFTVPTSFSPSCSSFLQNHFWLSLWPPWSLPIAQTLMLTQSDHHPEAVFLIPASQISPYFGPSFILPCSGNIFEALQHVLFYFSPHQIKPPEQIHFHLHLSLSKFPSPNLDAHFPSVVEPNIITQFLNSKCSSLVSLNSPSLVRRCDEWLIPWAC